MKELQLKYGLAELDEENTSISITQETRLFDRNDNEVFGEGEFELTFQDVKMLIAIIEDVETEKWSSNERRN